MAKYLSADSPVETLNVHLFLLGEHLVSTNVVHVRNKDMTWFNVDCRRSFHPLLLLVLLLLKEAGSARLRDSDIHPTSPMTTAPQ